ncbi:hypothetical protein CANARDRAFT_17298 [[Candida] arabinofermentans NRRL YB-2248]|uniref:Dolichyl-diphosphooligosaccharide-protein glycosyltransferase subunit OST5 n=1 Tax=[Candida] arabinofermentans NRRL YB-2248 TaxID=983967 RepID=A0A1E4T2Q4_9ASCO|nr:hypothetical protein CANARDRAFT_17298 [[Candida] arabinofermentans NRRL YB-2248]
MSFNDLMKEYHSFESYNSIISNTNHKSLAILFCTTSILSLLYVAIIPRGITTTTTKDDNSILFQSIIYIFFSLIASISIGFGTLFLASCVGIYT